MSNPTKGSSCEWKRYAHSPDVIFKVNIATTGNSTDFGELTEARFVTGVFKFNKRIGIWRRSTPTKIIDFLLLATFEVIR